MDTIFWVALGLMIAGVAGSFLPIVPGPILSFAGLATYYLFQEKNVLSGWIVLFFALGVVFLAACEYILPILGARFSGASKAGQWGAVIGALIGLVIFPPFGIFVGAIVGATIGEMQSGKEISQALKATIGIVLGGLASILLQIIFSLSVIAYFLFETV